MAHNLLEALRIALPGAPSLRILADQVGCSHEKLRQFERGESMIGEAELVKLAKITRLAAPELKRRFWFVALERCEERRREVHRELQGLGVKDPRRRSGPKSA